MARTRTVQVAGRALDVPVTLLDRVIESWWPERGAQRMKSRVIMAMGGYSGASITRGSLASWSPHGTDADALTADLPILRDRSSDLIRNSPVAGGAITTTALNVVGTGLAMNSRIDHEVLGMSEDEAAAWQRQAEREFELWAESNDCSADRRGNFYAVQNLAFISALEKGDVLVTTPVRPSVRQPYGLCVQLTEAERVSNPSNGRDSETMVAGVEINSWGEHIAYHVSDRHPGSVRPRSGSLAWRRIPAWGLNGSRRNAWLIADQLRVGQTRGIPWLASVIEPLKQMERYTDAELNAAVVSAMFTVFITSEDAGGHDLIAGSETAPGEEWDGRLRNGAAVALNPGDKIETANPGRPNAQFDPFVQAILRQVGMRLNLPFEVLIKHYTASYSAARAAMLDAWRFFRSRRAWLVTQLCQPIYELWLSEAIAIGRIRAPGFFADPLVRRAYCGAEWVGDGPGSIDPAKDVGAAKERIDLGISTVSAESLLHDGIGWEVKHRQRVRETDARRRDGLTPEPQGAARPGAQPPAEREE